MKKILLFIGLFFTFMYHAKAESIVIQNFVIKENPFGKSEIAIVAEDSLQNIQENINGVFKFTINGFQENLRFENGTAFYRQKLERSSFIFLKHQNDLGNLSKLYYIYKHDSKLDLFLINWIWLIGIPLGLMLLAYLFKRFIIIAVILLGIFFYFNYKGGMSIPAFFETVFDGLRNLF
jgi:hypothetical protein